MEEEEQYKISVGLSWFLIFALIVPLGIAIYIQWEKMVKEFDYPGYELNINQSPKVSKTERLEIDTWIAENNLNQYGDPKGTMYPGGTPLFNETTKKKISRYEYIIKKHPDKPWRK